MLFFRSSINLEQSLLCQKLCFFRICKLKVNNFTRLKRRFSDNFVFHVGSEHLIKLTVNVQVFFLIERCSLIQSHEIICLITMGGCRCTYRNCMVKTDGKTHMFHYPVFDKMRCHQWLINAHRLEFFNLKVSQLKNRVVCQHHFRDECFMNFKKEKLTFEAIPTENGPYCDPSKWIDNSQEFSKLYPIVLEDIENDYFSIDDKKANFSLKYLDFLTNSDSIDSPYLKTGNNSLPTKECDYVAELNFVLDNNVNSKTNVINENINEPDLLNDKLTSIQNRFNKSQMKPILIVSPHSDKNMQKITKDNQCTEMVPCTDSNLKAIPEPASKKSAKVKIISEKKLTKLIPLSGTFEPISPQFLLNAQQLKHNNLNTNQITSGKGESEQQKTIIKQNNVPITAQKQTQVSPEKCIQNVKTLNETLNNPHPYNIESTKISILKKKIPPERKAAIQEKRKFNMKLKDVIESYANKSEEPELIPENKTEHSNKNFQQTVQTLPKDSVLQNYNKGYLSFLESRMNRMENLLLNKIDQNSQRIMDLKTSLATTSSQKKKSVSSQTNSNEEAYKKFLYTEISKYLSSESNNLIYEELFIDKFVKTKGKQTLHKRRRYR